MARVYAGRSRPGASSRSAIATGTSRARYVGTSRMMSIMKCYFPACSTTAGAETIPLNAHTARAAPTTWETTKNGASAGRIPANVSVSVRATVTAGLANDVDAVNQYAPAMYAATANGIVAGRWRTPLRIVRIRPNVATVSLTPYARPART